MKESFPFLAYWKKTGIKKFPKLVDDPAIFERFIVAHIERYPKVFKEPALISYRESEDPVFTDLRNIGNPVLNIVLQPPPEQEVWEMLIRPNVVKLFLKSISRKCEQNKQNVLDSVEDAQRQIIYEGALADKIAEPLGRRLLSKYHAKGGKAFKTEFHKEIIILMYGEMQHAIRRIRQAAAIPCIIRDGQKWSNDDETELILECVPYCEEIFDRKELHDMTANPSVTYCAILIIRKRLKSYLPPLDKEKTDKIKSLQRLLKTR